MAAPTVDYESRTLPVNEIVVPEGRRHLTVKTVELIAESVSKIGLQTPITVRVADDYPDEDGELGRAYILIAGAHRLSAFKLLGERYIPSIIRDCTEIEARKWEISENLHRAELKTLEREEQRAEWIALTEKQIAEERLSFQSETKVDRLGREGAHRPEGGINAASRELGISKSDAHRAVAVASLPEEAKQAARESGLADNRTALLAAAKEMKTHGPEAAIAKINEIAASKAMPKLKPTPAADKAVSTIEALETIATGIVLAHPVTTASPIVEQLRAMDEAERKKQQRDSFWKFWASLDDDVREDLHAKLRTM